MNRPQCLIHARKYSLITLFVIGLWQWGQAAMITGKAYLAHYLIAHAWQQTLATGHYQKPWPWADTWPVARITFKDGKSFYILAGGKGNSLAFGPAHLSETALPGETGSSVIGGHRDTHFALLQHSQTHDLIRIQNRRGENKTYRIQKRWIADSKKAQLHFDKTQNSVYLITCYPFATINPNGTERLIVKADQLM